jgi:hypothetical protein
MKITDAFDLDLLRFIREYGTDATYTKVSNNYNPSVGSTEEDSTTYQVKVIVSDLTLSSNGYSVKYGTLIQAGDKEILMQPYKKTNPLEENFIIDPATDSITVGGVVYGIVAMKVTDPSQSDPLLYSFYVRR